MEEKLILTELREKNINVYEMLFNEHYASLVRFCEGMLFDPFAAEDEVQQLFVHLWENLDQLEIKSSLKGYLFRSARNRCLNRIKVIQVYDKNKLLYKEGILNSQDLNHEFEEEIDFELKSAFEKLPDQQLKIATLKYQGGKKYAEIAELLGISINTVKTQLARAKEKIRINLDKLIILIFMPWNL